MTNISNNVSHNDLSENSISYQNQADVYQLFSNAEDYNGLVLEKIIPLIQNHTLIDIGCGNGKYCHLLKYVANHIIGIDKSIEHLAKDSFNSKADVVFLQADATYLPLANNSTDIVLACWMLGTITQRDRQLQALQEMKRVCNNKIILIENNIDSEFELLRGRHSLSDNRTNEYNTWLIGQGFSLYQTIDTFFEFETSDMAQHVFSSIWQDRLTKKIINNKIEHSINIYVYQK
jgi:ubiquinone/menaquinone biosynthesis C-methylase UbiE